VLLEYQLVTGNLESVARVPADSSLEHEVLQ
jgi:hypothetical protein